MKLASPFIMSFVTRQFLGIDNKKKKNVDFDILVEQKKSMMRGGTREVSTHVNTRKSSRTAFEQRVNENFAKLSSKANKTSTDTNDLENIKKVIDLFDKLQWGTGDHLLALSNEMKKVLGYPVSLNSVFKVLKASLQNNLLQKIPISKPISIKEIAKVLAPPIYLDLFITDHKFRAKQFKVTDMTSKHAVQTLLFLNHRVKIKNDKKAFEQVFKHNKSIVSEEEKKSLLTENNKLVQTETLKSNIEQYLQVFISSENIIKIENKKDLKEALEVFGFKSMPNEKNLKNQYKYLVKTRHPDKLESYQLPSHIKKQIHENFATIQQAYDILKGETKG